MSLEGYRNAASAPISGGWTGATNVFASDDADASITANNSDTIRPQDYGFSIPARAIITGLEVWIEGEGDQAAQGDRDLTVSITKDGAAAVGTSKTANLPQTTDAPVVLGGPTDLWGIGIGVDVAEANASTFGVYIVKTSAVGTVNIDHVVLRAYYLGGIRAEFKFDTNNRRITLKHLYVDYDGGAGGTLPAVGDVLFNTTTADGVARVVTREDWSVLAFGTYALGELHGTLTWSNNDALEVCSYVDVDTEVNGGFSELDVGKTFTVSAGTGTRSGVIRHVSSDGVAARIWWDPTGESGTALVGDETLAVDGQDRGDAAAAETANAHTAAVNANAYEPERRLLDYDAETVAFEAASGSKRLRDTLGFQYNMVVCDTTSGATAEVRNDRENQLVDTEGSLFLHDVEGTFGDDNPIEACVEIDYDTEVAGGFFDLIGLAGELEGASSLATATVRRVIDNGTTGTLYVTGVAGGPFTPGEILRKNTGDVTRGNMTSSAQRDRVGAATINGTGALATAAFFATQDLYSDIEDIIPVLTNLDDDDPMDSEVRDQGFRVENSWELPYFALRWMLRGAVSEFDAVGGADTDSVFTDYAHDGSFVDPANTQVYAEQDGEVLPIFWDPGTFEFLLRNKNKDVEIDAGRVTFHARLFGNQFAFKTLSAIGLRNGVAISTADDLENDSSRATVEDTQVYHDIRVMFAAYTIAFDTGSGPIPASGDVVYNVTAAQAGQVCGRPASAVSGSDLHLAANGQDYSGWGAGETLDLLDYTDFDGQASQFIVGEAVENQTDSWNATVRYVQQYGASRGRMWYSGETGSLADSDTIRLDGAGSTRATSNGGGTAAGVWTALTNGATPETSDNTAAKDFGDGGGDQPYYAVIDANQATAKQVFELIKLLSDSLAGGTTDAGGVLYPDNVEVQGRLYQKAAAAVSAASIVFTSPLGQKSGAVLFLAEGVFIEDLQDPQNARVIDANGVPRSPPNSQNISVANTTTDGLASVAVHVRAESKASGGDTMDFNATAPATIDFNGSGDFLDDGFRGASDFRPTKTITITGTGSNQGTYDVADVTAGVATLVDGETLVDEQGSTTAVARGDNINKDQFSGASSGNDIGDPDFVVLESLPGYLPAAGVIVVEHRTNGTEPSDGGYEDILAYSSFTGSTLTLDGATLPRSYDGSARVRVPYHLLNPTSDPETTQYIQTVDLPLKITWSRKGFKRFVQDVVAGASGFSFQVVQTADPIVE